MRFLVDECAGPMVAKWLAAQGHEVFSVYDLARGMKDDLRKLLASYAALLPGQFVVVTEKKVRISKR